MNPTLYACIHVAEFPAQALLRLRPDLQGQPVAVLEGRAPHEFICSLNAAARRLGVACGMTRLDGEGVPTLRLLARSPETEVAARAVLLECAARFSPRIEEAGQGTACAVVLDIAGTERLFGPPEHVAERLRSSLAAIGLRASVAVSVNYETARIKAAASRGISVIPAEAEAAALAKLPLTYLNLPEDAQETFAIWGIRMLGELAALPEVELIARMGQQARVWRQAAWGELPHMFQPIEPEFTLCEFCAFDDPIEQIDSLLFIGSRMIQSLVNRAAERALALALIHVRMKLENGQMHERILRPALPSADSRFLLKLLQLEIGAHPPNAAVIALELHAEAGHCSTVQMGLFTPQTPEPSRLDVTLARIRAIVGEDRVGSPVLEDSHRPGAFHMEPLTLNPSPQTHEPDAPRMALRRMRPPVPVNVSLHAQKPSAFRDGISSFEITAAYGPWRSNGCWWSTDKWNIEEWDVLAARRDGPPIACLLVRDQHNEWQLEAIYD